MLSVSRTEDVCGAARSGSPCECEGRCLGYDSQDECPPLIVFAVQAMELVLGKVPPLMKFSPMPAGAR
jgi:hypothetical protein